MPRDVGPWALNKLKLLQLYLPGYLQATTRAQDRIFIDAFAGPGTNRLRTTGELIDGSPLIALDARAKDNDSRFTQLVFIENDPKVADELEALFTVRGDPRARLVRGDVNDELPSIVRAFHPRAPIFVFLDTDSIEPRWATI